MTSYVLGLCVMAASLQVALGATPVPEIDGGTMVSGVGLLAGGLMVLRARWSR
jgi:hypothetical protein